MRLTFSGLVLSLSLVNGGVTARAEAVYAGPCSAMVVRVIDGDTLEVRADIWPGLVSEVHVRVRDIDTPDVDKNECKMGLLFEREVDERVTDWPTDQRLRLTNVSKGSFARRVVADVEWSPGERWFSLSEALLERGYGVAYEEGSSPPWCLLARSHFSGAR